MPGAGKGPASVDDRGISWAAGRETLSLPQTGQGSPWSRDLRGHGDAWEGDLQGTACAEGRAQPGLAEPGSRLQSAAACPAQPTRQEESPTRAGASTGRPGIQFVPGHRVGQPEMLSTQWALHFSGTFQHPVPIPQHHEGPSPRAECPGPQQGAQGRGPAGICSLWVISVPSHAGCHCREEAGSFGTPCWLCLCLLRA